MANEMVKAQRIVRTALGLLEREIVLPALVWQDPVGDFAGALGDTVSIRLPAYTSARTRVLRGGTPITMDELTETKVDVSLDTDVYKAVPITDEELTLDIADFGEQVLEPVVRSVARGIEDMVGAEMEGATYPTIIEIANTGANPVYDALIDARKALNNASVPAGGRALVVGSDIEAKLLKSEGLVQVDKSGSDSALREAVIGRIAGFTAVSSPTLNPKHAYAFHRTAYVLSTRAPVVPEGVTFGATASFAGQAMRVIRDYDFLNVRDRLLADTFAGTNIVQDNGYVDANGKFIPNDDDAGSNVTLATSAAADDIFDTTAAHGFVAGDRVVFTAITGGGAGAPVVGQAYYVSATSLAAQTFRVSATPGGTLLDFASDITAGTVVKDGRLTFVRAVKLTDLT